MKTFAKQSLFSVVFFTIISSMSSMVLAADVTGNWRSIDDKTGFAKSIIKIEKNENGTYSGTIEKVLTHEGYTPKKFCVNCPAPFTDKPIEGLNIIWGLVAVPSADGVYDQGKILDPLSGKIYRAKLTLSANGKTLNVRGYIGFSMFGRSQIWQRETE